MAIKNLSVSEQNRIKNSFVKGKQKEFEQLYPEQTVGLEDVIYGNNGWVSNVLLWLVKNPSFFYLLSGLSALIYIFDKVFYLFSSTAMALPGGIVGITGYTFLTGLIVTTSYYDGVNNLLYPEEEKEYITLWHIIKWIGKNIIGFGKPDKRKSKVHIGGSFVYFPVAIDMFASVGILWIAQSDKGFSSGDEKIAVFIISLSLGLLAPLSLHHIARSLAYYSQWAVKADIENLARLKMEDREVQMRLFIEGAWEQEWQRLYASALENKNGLNPGEGYMLLLNEGEAITVPLEK